jgi:hypothetical protein
MPTLVSTQTFVQGNVLNADALTNHVIDAKPLATFISGQDAVASPAPADEFLIATAGASPARKVSLSTLAANLPTGTSAASLAVTGATTLTGALTANGNTILGDAAADTLTVNATSSFGAPVTVSSDTTLGTAAVASATWARTTTALTVTKTAHGLTTGNSRYFVFTGTSAVPVASSVLNGTYTVTVTSVDVFTVTVADAGDIVGNVTWYEKALTISSTLTGPLQGNIPINVASVELGTGDEFLFKDVSDSNRLKTTVGAFIKAWANISANPVTVSATYSRDTGSQTMTVTKTAHGFRVDDVAYFTGTGLTAGWYSVVTVANANTFTIVTATTSLQSNVAINWYSHALLAGNNTYSAYGKDSSRIIRVNFTNKPPSVDSYILNLSAVKFTSSVNLYTPQVNNIDTNVPSNIIKTVSGFAFVSYSTTGLVTSTSGEFHFQSIW